MKTAAASEPVSPIAPDWSRLAIRNRTRSAALGLAPDPRDRSGKGFWQP